MVSTSNQTLDHQERRAVRSHATRAQQGVRRAARLQSWVNPHRSLGSERTEGAEQREPPERPAPGPSRVGGDFSALQLPPGIEPAMIQDLVKRMPPEHRALIPSRPFQEKDGAMC